MNLIVITILLLLCTSESHAGAWKFITQGTSKSIIEVNTASIEDVGKTTKRAEYRINYWLLPNGMQDNRRILAIVADFDCTRSRYKVLQSTSTGASWQDDEEVVKVPIYGDLGPDTSVIYRIYSAVCSPEPSKIGVSDPAIELALTQAKTARQNYAQEAEMERQRIRIEDFERNFANQTQSNYNSILRARGVPDRSR
jgi:hypothetical protein